MDLIWGCQGTGQARLVTVFLRTYLAYLSRASCLHHRITHLPNPWYPLSNPAKTLSILGGPAQPPLLQEKELEKFP